MLLVDQTKCKKDGLCAGDCPMSLIHLPGGDGFPEMVPGGEGLCLACGHCVAICPHGALNHSRVPLEKCPPLEKNLVIDAEAAIQFLRSRRSTRFFQDRPVEKETLQKLIEIARYAPTGSNTQAVEWIVVTDREDVRRLAGQTVDWMRDLIKTNPKAVAAAPYLPLIVAAWDAGFDAVLRNAPALVVASAPKEILNGMVDVTLALSYLDLAAVPMGLGACWAGLFKGALDQTPALREALGLPAGHLHHYGLMLGYARNRYFRLPERKQPKITWK